MLSNGLSVLGTRGIPRHGRYLSCWAAHHVCRRGDLRRRLGVAEMASMQFSLGKRLDWHLEIYFLIPTPLPGSWGHGMAGDFLFWAPVSLSR